MNGETAQLTPTVRLLLALAAFVVIVAGMRAADALLVPFLLSLFIAVIAAPPLFYLKQRGVPGGLAMMIVIALIVVIGILIGWMIGGSLNDFMTNLPKYQERLSLQSGKLVQWLQAQGLHRAASPAPRRKSARGRPPPAREHPATPGVGPTPPRSLAERPGVE